LEKFTISLIALLSTVLIVSSAQAQQEPGKDMTAIPAIAEGLSLHNLFQFNMVLQRERPITIWGWADPGEEVSVSFGGQTQTTKAGADRSWKVIGGRRPCLDPVNTTRAGRAGRLNESLPKDMI